MDTVEQSRSRADTAYGTLSESALRALLDRDRSADCVVVSRGNKISRKHYAGLLKCTRSALTRFAFVFAEYELQLGVTTGPLRHLPEMRKWLTIAYENRQLKLRGGKLDRLAFMTHFELQGGTVVTRHAPIRELLEEFDARAERDGYLLKGTEVELDRVRSALAEKPVLNKDRMTINLVWLARTARVSPARFREKVFADVLAQSQADIMKEVRSSKIDPYVQGRAFAFSDLLPVWQRAFLTKVGIRFKQIAAGLAQETPKAPYLQLVELLRWIGESENPQCRAVLAEANAKGRITSAGDWEDVLFAYRSQLLSVSATEGMADSVISALRIALDGLSSGRIVPTTAMPIPGVKHVRRRRSHLRSFAEAGTTNDSDIEHDYVAFARERFLHAAKGIWLDMGASESDEFISGLALELTQTDDLAADPVVAIRQVLDRRLDALRSAAVSIVEEAIKTHQKGCELLSRAEIDGEGFEREYLDGSLSQYERGQLVRKYFPHPRNATNSQVEQGVANLLSLIEEQHDGLTPHNGSHDERYGQFFAKRYLDYGGLGVFASMLYPMPATVGAVLTLYLIESGANVGVGRTLDRACMEVSDLKEHRRITGHKARAKGKPIIIDLPDTSPAVRAMDWLLSANSRLKVNAQTNDNNLFLMRIGGRVQLMTPHWYTNWFKKFVASTPGLQSVKLLPNMIRPSVLLQAALANDGRLATGMAIGQHGVATTQGYQQKWPTRLLYDENIRCFHNAFETLVMSGVEDAASKLGISPEQFEARLGQLRATGLGTFCRDQSGRASEAGGKCKTLDCWNECPHLLIVAEAEAIAALQLWQASLREQQPDWERDRPERWDEVWLPWLCLTDVVEEKMTRGPLIKVWKAAQLRASEISAQSAYVPPKPW